MNYKEAFDAAMALKAPISLYESNKFEVGLQQLPAEEVFRVYDNAELADALEVVEFSTFEDEKTHQTIGVKIVIEMLPGDKEYLCMMVDWFVEVCEKQFEKFGSLSGIPTYLRAYGPSLGIPLLKVVEKYVGKKTHDEMCILCLKEIGQPLEKDSLSPRQ